MADTIKADTLFALDKILIEQLEGTIRDYLQKTPAMQDRAAAFKRFETNIRDLKNDYGRAKSTIVEAFGGGI